MFTDYKQNKFWGRFSLWAPSSSESSDAPCTNWQDFFIRTTNIQKLFAPLPCPRAPQSSKFIKNIKKLWLTNHIDRAQLLY